MTILGYSQQVILDKTKSFTLTKNAKMIVQVKVEKLKDGTHKTSILRGEKVKSSFSIKPFSYENFASLFRSKFKEATSEELKPNTNELMLLYFDAKMYDNNSQTPEAGKLSVSKCVPIGYLAEIKITNNNQPIDTHKHYFSLKSIDKIGKKNRNSFVFEHFELNRKINRRIRKNHIPNITKITPLYLWIKDLQMEVYNGFIENISVSGTVYNHNNTDTLSVLSKNFSHQLKIFQNQFTDSSNIDTTFNHFIGKLNNQLKLKPLPISEIDETLLEFKSKIISEKFKTEIKIIQELRDSLDSIPYPIIGENICFTNNIPIGISSKHCLQYKTKKPLVSAYVKLCGEVQEIAITARVCDIIEYHPNFALNTKDYSPANRIYEEMAGEKNKTLYKEKSENLFDAKIFTDLNAYGEQNSNGVVQTEISKEIAINTNRYAFNNRRYTNYGFFQYITPYFSYSKLEDTDYALKVKLDDTNKYETSLINIYKNERLRIGSEFNLAVLDLPQFKSNLWLDFGTQFGQIKCNNITNEENNTENNFTVNSLYFFGKLKYKVHPDKRFGLEFSYKVGHYDVLNDKMKQTDYDPKDSALENSFYWLHELTMQTFVRTGDKGKVFFRYKIASPIDNWDNNFTQLQLGYSFDILRKIK